MKTLIAIFTGVLFILSTTSGNAQSYYMSKKMDMTFEEAVAKTKEALKTEGFGVMTEIRMDEKLSEKLDNVNMQPYLILGVCNPKYAFKTVNVEENIGLFLPCKVLVKKISDTQSEVVMIDPAEAMKAIGNTKLDPIAQKVTVHFKTALDKL